MTESPEPPGPGGPDPVLRLPPGWVLESVAETGSTNDDVVARARAGAPAGLVLAAEAQTAGRGRRGRSWTAPPGSGLAVSVLLRPTGLPLPSWGWLPLLTGCVVAESVRRETGLAAGVKWPNDVLVGGRKLAGVLVERVAPDAAVVGVGLNVDYGGGAPSPTATSLALELGGHPLPDEDRRDLRDRILASLLDGLHDGVGALLAARGDAGAAGVRERYRAVSATLGLEVRLHLPDGRVETTRALDVDPRGALVTSDRAVDAGEIVHLR